MLNRPTLACYVKWIASNLGVTEDAAQRYVNGSRNIPAAQASFLLQSIGGDASNLPVDHKRHAQWEVNVALGLEADPSLYSPQLDRLRARLAIDTHLAALIAPASQPGDLKSATTPSTANPQGERNRDAATDPRRRQLNSAVSKLDDPLCLPLLGMLGRECQSPITDVPEKATRADIAQVLKHLRQSSGQDRLEPVYAVCRALSELKKRRDREMTPTTTTEFAEAAKAVFSLYLMDYAIAVPAALSEDDLPLVYVPVNELLGAALLLDDAVGYDLHFTRTGQGAHGAKYAAVSIAVDGYLAEDHIPGILPGKQEQALRQDIESRLLVSMEASDKTGHRFADSPGARLGLCSSAQY